MKRELINIKFGQTVKYYRELNNLTQEQLSFESGLHRSYIGQIERAEKNITIRNVAKIADALNIDLKDLFDFSKIKNINKWIKEVYYTR